VTGRLVLLGTKGGPAVRTGGAMPTASFLDLGGRKAVIDCGIGVTRALAEAGESLKDLDLVFITHLHSDHVLELGPLIHTAWTTGMAGPVTVYGPPGVEDYWRHFLASMDVDTRIRVEDEGRAPLADLVAVRTYGEGEVMAEGGYRVSALRVDHPPVTDCFALRVQAAGKAVVFSADTAYFPPLIPFARGADVLVHEAMLPEGVERLIARTGLGDRLRNHLHASHTTAQDAGCMARAAEVRHLVLNHLVPADDPDVTEDHWRAAVSTEWAGPVTVGRDGLDIPL
jgi:ribonuclease BN (tRNA processing enzyme)